MGTIGHDPDAFREPIGFIDILALLTLAAAVVTTGMTIVTAIGSWLL